MDTEKVENSSLTKLQSEAETSDVNGTDKSVTESETIKIPDTILTNPNEITMTEEKCETDVGDTIINDKDQYISKEETVKISDTELTETTKILEAEEEIKKEETDHTDIRVTNSAVNEHESGTVTDCKTPDNVISVTNTHTEGTSNVNERTVQIESKETDIKSCNGINQDESIVPNAIDQDKSEEVDSNINTSYTEVTVTHEDEGYLVTKDKKKRPSKIKTVTETDDDSSYETVSSSSSWCSASETEENETTTSIKKKLTIKTLKSSSGKGATAKRVLCGDVIDVKSSKIATSNKEVKLKKSKSKSSAKVITEVSDEKKKAKVSSSSDKSTKKRTIDDKQSNLLNDSKSLLYKQSPNSSSLKVTIRNTTTDVAVNNNERTVEVDDNEQEEPVTKAQSAKREETTLLDNSSSSDESVSLENRQSGDGEEIEEDARPVVLPADEDRKNPQYVPKRGYFYEHDNRMNNSAGEDEEEENESTDSEEKIEPSKLPKGKKLDSDKWSHDLYDPDEQMPKSSAELIQEYGYDIRQEDSAPKTRRRKKYSGKDVKYSRNPADAEAYQKKPTYRKSQELYTPNKFKGKYNNSRLSITAESKSVHFAEDMSNEKLLTDSNNKEGYMERKQLTESPRRNRSRTSNNYIEAANNTCYKPAKRNIHPRNYYDYRYDQEDRQLPAPVRKSEEIRTRNYQDSNPRNKNRLPTSLQCTANFDKLKEPFNSNYDRSSPKFTTEAAMNHKYRTFQRDDNSPVSKVVTAVRAETITANEAASYPAAKTVFNATVETATSVTAKTTATAIAPAPNSSTFIASNHSTVDSLITGATNKKLYYGKGRLQTLTQRHGKSHTGLSSSNATGTIVSMNFSPSKKITSNKADEYKQQLFRSDNSDVKNVNKDIPPKESPSSDTKADTVVNNNARSVNSVNESGFKNFPVSAKTFLEKHPKDSSLADSKTLLEDEKNNESKEEQPKFSARYSVRRGFNPNRYGNKPLDMEKFRKHVQARKYNGNSALSDVVGPLHPFLPSSQPNIQQQIQSVPSSVPFYKLQDNRRPSASVAVVATAQHMDQQSTRPATIAQQQLQTEAPPMAYYSHQGYSVETPAAVVPRMYGTHDNGPTSAQPPVQYVAYHPPLIPPSNEHSSAPYSPMMAYPPPPPPPPPVPPPHHQATQQLVTYGPEQYMGNTHIQHLNNNQATSLPLDVYQSPNGVTYYNTTAQIHQQQQSQFTARRANAAIQIIPPEIPPDIDIS